MIVANDLTISGNWVALDTDGLTCCVLLLAEGVCNTFGGCSLNQLRLVLTLWLRRERIRVKGTEPRLRFCGEQTKKERENCERKETKVGFVW